MGPEVIIVLAIALLLPACAGLFVVRLIERAEAEDKAAKKLPDDIR